MSETPQFTIEREFDAPRSLVWQAWTQPDLLARWYGPNVETIVHEFDLKPGGRWLGEMKWGGNSHYSVAEFTEIVPEERLVWLHSSSDAEWNIIASPMMPDWPRVILTTVTFTDTCAKTGIRLTWTPHGATATEIECFSGAMEKFGGGWNAGFAIMDEVLAEIRKVGT